MIAFSPAELALLHLMTEVGAPLRLGGRGQAYFLGRQDIRCELGEAISFTELCRNGLLEERPGYLTPGWLPVYDQRADEQEDAVVL